MKYTKQKSHHRKHDEFTMPTARKFLCDGCLRRKPSEQAVVEGIYVFCRKCMKERRHRSKGRRVDTARSTS